MTTPSGVLQICGIFFMLVMFGGIFVEKDLITILAFIAQTGCFVSSMVIAKLESMERMMRK